MLNFPNAKINLGLHITEKRKDGYHNIDSCFYPIPMKDILEIVDAEESRLITKGLSIPGDPQNNLIWKAFQMIRTDFTIPEQEILLYKNIPMGAGMGGGSADGAFMLTLMNQKFKLGLNIAELEAYALQLGSDCPFFIQNQPKHVMGRGEILNNIEIDLSGWHLALVFPGIHIGTKEAYAGITPNKNRASVKEIIEGKAIADWKNELMNDFEASVFNSYPQLAEIKTKLYEAGATYAAMTGSGSTLFGIFKEQQDIAYVDQWLAL